MFTVEEVFEKRRTIVQVTEGQLAREQLEQPRSVIGVNGHETRAVVGSKDVIISVVSSSGHVKSAQLRISDRQLSRSPERKLSQEVSAMVSKFEALAASSGGDTVSTHSGQQRTNLE